MAKVHCQGMCEFGSEAHAYAWRTYDGSKCHCQKCMYSEMCGDEWYPLDYLAIKGGWCNNCDIMRFHNRIAFRDCPEGEECAVCYGTDRQAKFTADGCVHWFCISCARTLMYCDETRHHLDPRAFGCPPCPNGCDNPPCGKQCYCEEYEAVIEEWEHREPKQPFWGEPDDMRHVQYCLWNAMELESIEAGEPEGSSRGKCVCPLCKRTA